MSVKHKKIKQEWKLLSMEGCPFIALTHTTGFGRKQQD